ncbi:hypothetical protein AUR04nite_04340 [Glutamicibacter uratoxydans]|uniref:Carrier domain-containing protein n=1 Tax=Glutamicibacter uratoxydans TaxID=43667 RepID=A0A4Y4DI28_GLUUR|nr:phosphopantetheine-binding protein [Glutamicibacter uratoxydans]GED04902.1 hypothetical protein AUR04nite_04340 [Glutamicibacter uratoxydans]
MSTPALTEARIFAELATCAGLPVDEVEPGDALADLGIDSIRLMSLVNSWRAAGAAVDFPRLAASESVEALVAAVLGAVSSS